MKPEAFLQSNSPRPSPASVVPATPLANARPIAGARQVAAPAAALSAEQYYELSGKYLQDNRDAPRHLRLEIIKWRHSYQLYREAAELKGNPAAEAELRSIAERLARKAQLGFAGPNGISATT